VDVPGVPRFEVAPHHCFACGTTNQRGLGLFLHVEPRIAWTTLTLERDFQGWDGIAHGGIIATILDEVMAWSLAGTDDWGVTARMAIAFRAPVPIDVPLRAEGRIAQQRRRVIETTGRLLSVVDGSVLATATGTYVAADEARKAELRERYGLRAVDADTPGPVAARRSVTPEATKAVPATAVLPG
jgi:acyl-coenzyme A thioesterase PaaI-like protein